MYTVAGPDPDPDPDPDPNHRGKGVNHLTLTSVSSGGAAPTYIIYNYYDQPWP